MRKIITQTFKVLLQIIFFFLLSLLSACKQIQTYDLTTTDKLQQYFAKKQKINHFYLSGKISVTTEQHLSNSGKKHNTTFSFTWQQNQDALIFTILDPLQRQVGIIHATPFRAVMQSDGKTIRASSIEELLMQFFGWTLPFEALKSWIFGVPISNIPYRVTNYAVHGLPSHLTQHDWQVYYTQYNLRALPQHITLNNQNLGCKIKIILTETKINSTYIDN